MFALASHITIAFIEDVIEDSRYGVDASCFEYGSGYPLTPGSDLRTDLEFMKLKDSK